ncbi:hypothetical protein AAFN46_18545 [Pseudomonas sp. CAU 1711]|uniref:hypothetical protein n=1 Tax=Pseudomonas sp. CAU 1711 TaxID=3140356 RepID=UPI003261D4E5
MRRLVMALPASLAIAPCTALFIALLTGSLRQGRLALEWPTLIDGVGYAMPEILLAAAPGMLIFLAASRHLRSRVARLALFAGCALLACAIAAILFAQAFGNTWSTMEILLELVAAQLDLIALAALPGALLVAALHPGRPA